MCPSPSIVKGNVQFPVLQLSAHLKQRFIVLIRVSIQCDVEYGISTVNLRVWSLAKVMLLPEEVVVVVLCRYLVYARYNFNLDLVGIFALFELIVNNLSELQSLDFHGVACASTFLHQFPGFGCRS